MGRKVGRLGAAHQIGLYIDTADALGVLADGGHALAADIGGEGIGIGVGIAGQLHMVAHRAERAPIGVVIVPVDVIAPAEQRDAILRRDILADPQRLTQLCQLRVGVLLKGKHAVREDDGQRVVPLVSRAVKQPHEVEQGAVEAAVVGVHLVDDDLIVGDIGDDALAVAVEDLTARRRGLHVVARRAGSQTAVFGAVKELPVGEPRQKHRRSDQHQHGADRERQLAAQFISHGHHRLSEISGESHKCLTIQRLKK